MKVFLAIPMNSPSKYLVEDMKKRRLEPIVTRSRNMAEVKKLILESDFVAHFAHQVDNYVRTMLDYARANDREVITIEWIKANINNNP